LTIEKSRDDLEINRNLVDCKNYK